MTADENPPPTAPRPPSGFELVVMQSTGQQVFRLPRGTSLVGRGADAELRVEDASVSRRHCQLLVDDRVRIRDLSSANGVAVRTERGGMDTTERFNRRLGPDELVELRAGESFLLGALVAVLRAAAPAPSLTESLPGTVIADPAMQALYATLDRVARGPIHVLLLGETGAGKEVFAAELHARSPRAKGPFVQLNCAAMSETLLESELFGHERGAFTGATGAKPGLLEVADGGTVFLDEVGEMPLAIQARFLRVLEDRKVLRVGSVKPRTIDVRIVSATNRDLKAESTRGVFRQDLYFRLNGVTLSIPPLRERPLEIEPLALHFIARFASLLGPDGASAPPALAAEARQKLLGYPWPGNIRELRNVLERATLLCSGNTIHAADLQLDEPEKPAAPTQPPPAGDERARILAALETCAWNQTQAAMLLGISRRTLVTRLGEFQLPRPRKR